MVHHNHLYKTLFRTLSVFVALCLVLGLAPAIALGDTAVNVKVEAPAQVNKTIELDSEDKASAPDIADSSASSDAINPEATPDQIKSEVTLSSDATPKPSQITTDVTLGTTPDTQAEALLQDGLIYLVDHELQTATLTGWYGNAPTGDLSVPSQVTDGKTIFKVQFAGGGTF
ncbi:MAG: hypothetical protein RR672_10125 [Raoultibacter sp.]